MAQDQAPVSRAAARRLPSARAPAAPARRPLAPAPARSRRRVRRVVLPLIAARRARLRRALRPTTGSSRAASSSPPTTPMSAPTPRSSRPRSPGHIVEVAVAAEPEGPRRRPAGADRRRRLQARRRRRQGQDRHPGRDDRSASAGRSRRSSAVIAQAEAQVGSPRRSSASAEADQQRAELEFDRSQKLADDSFGSQQRLEQAAADRARTAAALAGAEGRASLGRRLRWPAPSPISTCCRRSASRPSARAPNSSPPRRRPSATSRSPRSARRSTASSATRRSSSANTRSRACVCSRWCALDSVYVDANFKETQLADIRPGQKVDVAVDALGGRVVTGVVKSIAPASGAQFSLLPPDNATGNFTKVVQRIPVRITLDPSRDQGRRAAPGPVGRRLRAYPRRRASRSRRCSARSASAAEARP